MAGGSDYFLRRIEDGGRVEHEVVRRSAVLDPDSGDPATDENGKAMYYNVYAEYFRPVITLQIDRKLHGSKIRLTNSRIGEKSTSVRFSYGAWQHIKMVPSNRPFVLVGHSIDDQQQADHFVTESETWVYEGVRRFEQVLD